MPEAIDQYTATRLSAELGLDNRKMRDILNRRTGEALRTPTFRQRKVRPKKGRGSYLRASRSSKTGRD